MFAAGGGLDGVGVVPGSVGVVGVVGELGSVGEVGVGELGWLSGGAASGIGEPETGLVGKSAGGVTPVGVRAGAHAADRTTSLSEFFCSVPQAFPALF